MIEVIIPYSERPPRLLADANYNKHIIRGLRRKRPDMYIVTAHAAGIDSVPDPDVLAYAAQHDLILLTHDAQTMPGHFASFLKGLQEGQFSAGIWYTPQTLPIGIAIQAILEAWFCSGHDEYRNRELRLP